MSQAPTKRRSHWPMVILSIISTAFGILLPLILVRIIPPEEVGKFKVFFLYLAIAPAFCLTIGVMNGLAYWSGQEHQKEEALKVSSTLILILALGSLLIGLALNSYIAAIFGWTQLQAALFAFALLGSIAGSYLEEAAIATGRIWTGALFYSGFELLRTSALIIALLSFKSLTAILLAHTAVVLIKFIVGYSYGYYLGLVGISFDAHIVRSVWRYAFPVSLAWAFGIFIGSADQFVLAPTISAAEFALYSIGCLSIAPILIFEHSITRVLIPQMSEAFSRKQLSRAAILYQSAVDNLSFLLIPAVAGLIVFATPIIEIFFTMRYSAAAHYLRLYAISYLFLIIPYDALPRARGQSDWILKTFLFFSCISLGLAFLLTKMAGPTGALCAILLSGFALRLYAIYYFRKDTALTLQQFLPLPSFVHYTLISVVLGLLALMVKDQFPNEHRWFLICGGCFAILYLLMALPLKNRSERGRQTANGLLMITQSLNIGGLERMALHLCEQMQLDRKWNVSLFAYDQSSEGANLLKDFEAKGIAVEAFKKPERFSLMVVIRILKNIYRNDIHVIHSHDLGGLIYAVLAKLCCFGHVSIVHTQHSFIHLSRNRRYRIYEKLLTFGIDKLIVVSEDTQKTYIELGVAPEKIHLIENGVEFLTHPLTKRSERTALRAELINQLPIVDQQTLVRHQNELWILYLARFFPGKGQERALQLWSALDDSLRKRSILCFIGPESQEGEFARIKQLIGSCPEPERIFMLGASNEPQRWLAAGDIFVSCSEFEGMPLGPLEAAGCGLPSLLSDIPGHSFLRDTSCQFELSNTKYGAQLLQKIVERVESDGERYYRELWEKGRSLRERFSIQEMSRKYLLLYAHSTTPEANIYALRRESYT